MTGWRIGWGIFPKSIISDAEKYAVNIYSCVNNFAQFGAIAALNGESEYFEYLKNSFKSRVKIMVDGINEIKGFHVITQMDFLLFC